MVSLLEEYESPFFPIGFYTIKNFLTDEEIEVINKHTESLLNVNATVNNLEETPSFLSYDNDGNPTKNIRDSVVCWLTPKNNQDIKNIYKKIISTVIKVNKHEFKFNLTDLETLQYTVYKEGQFYKKHLDCDRELDIGNTQRKLSFSIQLTDPNEYMGGDLLGFVSEKYITAEKEKGSIIFFPSFMLHEVTAVTSGVRKSLVGWVHGPRFI